jgi:uncharacterized protein
MKPEPYGKELLNIVAETYFPGANYDDMGCVGSGTQMKMLSGRYFDLADPKPDQFTLQDIGGALARLCRYGGHCREFYSVAEHSYHCATQAMVDRLPLGVIRACLLHDAAEAFCGDVIRPLKVMLRRDGAGAYGAIYERVERCIEKKYLRNPGQHSFVSLKEPAVAEIDVAMLFAERRALFDLDGVKWDGEDSVRKIEPAFRMWDWRDAEYAFMRMARDLGLED